MHVSHPDKPLFPEDGISKGEVVAYYETVAPVMVPHLAGRPLTLERYPQGIGAKGFMQKNAAKAYPSTIGKVEVAKTDGTVTHPLITSSEGLLYLANQNTITFHIWTSRLPHLERPDRLVLDLDPPDEGFHAAQKAAKVIGDLLSELGLEAGLMATGSSGYHLVVPIGATHQFEVVERCSLLLAGVAAARHPKLLTTEFLIRKRAGRVFIDWLRNRWAQSVVAPWSLRPRPGAPVATPIAWEELPTTEPDKWTIRTVHSRISQPDPWPAEQSLPVSLIEGIAAEAGVSADQSFDRFGRDHRS
jgi:bifunctional non-homologous end joining protein LigD